VFGRKESRVAQREYEGWLGSPVPERAVQDAVRGWERTRDRESGIEAKSQSFLQIVGVTTTLLANGTLLHGQDAIKGAAATAVVVCLALASAALIADGVYGLFGSMRTFVRVAANSHGGLSNERISTRATAARSTSQSFCSRRTGQHGSPIGSSRG